MQVPKVSRFVPRWLFVFAVILIVAGNICEFSGEAHGATPAPEHRSDQSGAPHHHGVAHLAPCENDAASTNSANPVAPDVAMFAPRLERFVEPLDVRAAAGGRLPAPLIGPPLFILHAALLI